METKIIQISEQFAIKQIINMGTLFEMTKMVDADDSNLAQAVDDVSYNISVNILKLAHVLGIGRVLTNEQVFNIVQKAMHELREQGVSDEGLNEYLDNINQ